MKTMIAPEIPFLRRYARAITGSQALGDAAVQEFLMAVLEAPEELRASSALRLELYRRFQRLWGKSAVDLKATAPMSLIDERARHALLLTAVEGFSADEAAAILNDTPAAIADLVEQARTAIAEHLRSDVLIIEDEAIIALHLKSIVAAQGHRVTGVARTSREAIELARQSPPELVLADINLADGSSGIDAVNAILSDLDAPVVFVTAYPERLLTGLRPEPAYLVTKPFEPQGLAALIGQALLFHRESGPTKALVN